MSNYFSYFPTTKHDIKNNGTTVDLTNVLRRFKIDSELKNNGDVFYDYQIQDGDRPDTVAEKYYGKADFAWLVLHFNDIEDAIFDWPLFGDNFENYIIGKYGSIATAQSTIHEYKIFLTHKDAAGVKTPAKKRINYNGEVVEERAVVVDLATFNATEAAYKYNTTGISKYDHEIAMNDAKRNSSLLDVKYLTTVRDEVETILRNGV
jgi:hypothetical protein